MNKNIMITVIITFLFLLQGVLLAQNTELKSNASLVFEEEIYDFGEVSNDTVLTHDFKFENTGTDTLFIRSVRGS